MGLLLVRHGETAWSREGKHTSVTDLPLTDTGEQQARELAPRLAALDVVAARVSPRLRARRTAELVGFGDAVVDDRLVEWAYGDLEGRRTVEIRDELPGWTIWGGPVPGGESAADVAARCDAVIAEAVDLLRAAGGSAGQAREEGLGPQVLLVAHGHLLRALTARWLGLDVADGRLFRLDTARLTELGHEREQRVIRRWNA
ncbi:MAG TPA: histidine phosphatase family protein [Nocardioides sp.]